MLGDSSIVIVGAGPAGASLAIRLAMRGYKVVLVEEKKFPRDKLCGEFISPECMNHFETLGVGERIKFSGGVCLQKTVFYAPSGRNFSFPSEWFGGNALSLSRACMDNELLKRAMEVGVIVFTEARVLDFSLEQNFIESVTLSSNGQSRRIRTSILVDATGRRRYVVKKLAQIKGTSETKKTLSKKLVAFKVHLLNAKPETETCEIYFYKGGYGGLSQVENGLYNLCFIVREEQARAFGKDFWKLVREVVCSNQRAAITLNRAEAASSWHSTTLQDFGYASLSTADNLFAVGDAAAFIDPFTGSGMLLALESSSLLAKAIDEHFTLGPFVELKQLQRNYLQNYKAKFKKRFAYCLILRNLAFASPLFIELAAFLFGKSPAIGLKSLARLTRASY